MVYNTKADKIIMIGGQIGHPEHPEGASGAVWIYDVAANQWAQMDPPAALGRRAGIAMAYDIESDRVITFGGANEVTWFRNDTWAYDYQTNTWTAMSTGPSPRNGSVMAYDAESDRVILFGGGTSGHTPNDTWAYDFNTDTWTDMNPASHPESHYFHAMAYDTESDRIILWGGRALDSVWAYDFNTNTWERMGSAGDSQPEAWDYTAMAYDTESDQMVIFGGLDTLHKPLNETWAYDYNTNSWTMMNPGTLTNPGKRWGPAAITYSDIADRVILFGGKISSTAFVFSEKTWSYDLNNNEWENLTP
jgi:N-acetylneuraminic acid mutarotase